MTWLPIETAPKGAVSVLLYVPTKKARPVREGFFVKDARGDYWAWYGYSGKTEARLNQPTRWMPLPNPPAE